MKGLDFANFKKVSQDKSSATLAHPDGHEIKIAVSGLNPAMRKKLAELPLHQNEPDKEVEALEEDEDKNAAAPQSPAPTPAPIQEVEDQEAENVAASEPTQAAPLPSAPQQQAAAPQVIPSDVGRVPAQPMQAEETPEQHYAKEVAWQQDLANRHIEPKTYQSLFADKGTLGKIGSIFGLLLSGAGSGLAHQSNNLLDMMNKEIDRDLEAQKQSKANAQNFLSTQYAHDLQNAQALHMSNQNALTQQQIAASKAEHAGQGQANEALNKRVVEGAGGTFDKSIEKQNAEIGVEAGAKNKMLSTAAQHLDDISANNPAAKAAVATIVRPAIDAQIKNNIATSVAKQKAAAALTSASQPSTPADKIEQQKKEFVEPVDEKKYQQMLQNGDLAENNATGKKIPWNPKTMIKPGDRDALDKAFGDIKANRLNYQDAVETLTRVSAMPDAGETWLGRMAGSLQDVPVVGGALAAGADYLQSGAQRPRDQELDHLAQRMSSRGASDKSIADMRKAVAPSMFDTPETRQRIPELLHQLFAHNPVENAGIFDRYPGLKKDIKKPKMHLLNNEEDTSKSIWNTKNKDQ